MCEIWVAGHVAYPKTIVPLNTAANKPGAGIAGRFRRGHWIIESFDEENGSLGDNTPKTGSFLLGIHQPSGTRKQKIAKRHSTVLAPIVVDGFPFLELGPIDIGEAIGIAASNCVEDLILSVRDRSCVCRVERWRCATSGSRYRGTILVRICQLVDSNLPVKRPTEYDLLHYVLKVDEAEHFPICIVCRVCAIH